MAVTGDEGTVVVALIGAAMLAVLSVRLAYLAGWTRRRVGRSQAALWEYFTFAGVVGVIYGGLALARLAAEAAFPFLDGLLLAFALLFALAIREAYFNATLSNAEVDRLGQFRLRRGLEFGFVGVVLLVAIGPLVRSSAAFTLAAAAGGAAVVCYGLYFHALRSATPATRGTLIDTLVRQSVPVLVFAGGAVIAPALTLVDVDAVVAETVAYVFVVVTAASLMTVTIKLSQHLSSLR